jgi:1,2-diacylglycerol 3-beta-galactosyltransferase
MSDTGGGHRAAAEAIQAAAEQRYPGALEFTLVDVFRHHTPFPFRYAPEIYPFWVNYAARTWHLSYAMTNSRAGSRIVMRSFYYYWRSRLRWMLRKYPADMILSVHSMVAPPVMQVLQEAPTRPPFMTVVTDLVSTHAFWYDPQVDRCLVPTEAAYERGLKFGMKDHQMRVTGLPVHPKFVKGLVSKGQARQDLNLPQDLPAVLIVSGGEGMGPLFDIADAINQRRLPCQLLIVAGRNEKLREQLDAHHWNQPTKIFGFVEFMPKLMASADLIVTKAGPATISEACMAGLPIVISGAIPGQEDGNIQLVTQNGVGVFAPGARRVAEAVAEMLNNGGGDLERRSESARKLARPDAVWAILEEVYGMAQTPPVSISPKPHSALSSIRALLSIPNPPQ